MPREYPKPEIDLGSFETLEIVDGQPRIRGMKTPLWEALNKMMCKGHNPISARMRKFLIELVAAVDIMNESEVPIHIGSEPPPIGHDIYVPTRGYIDHGQDDICGGLGRVSKVESNKYSNTFVQVEELPGRGFNWDFLREEQEKLKKQFGKNRCHPDPDYGYYGPWDS